MAGLLTQYLFLWLIYQLPRVADAALCVEWPRFGGASAYLAPWTSGQVPIGHPQNRSDRVLRCTHRCTYFIL